MSDNVKINVITPFLKFCYYTISKRVLRHLVYGVLHEVHATYR